MPKFVNDVYVTKKELKILSSLFFLRGATVDQLVRAMGYYYPNNPEKTKSGKASFYPLLKRLKEIGLVTSFLEGFSEIRIYFLTDDGYSQMLGYYSIDRNYKGTGFNRDYSHMAYNTYKPPLRQLSHFSLQVDIWIRLEEVAKTFKGDMAYRDNLYSVRHFSTKETDTTKNKVVEKRIFFKPDGELVINNETYLLEADTGSERGEHLRNKFMGYRKYFDYLRKNNKSLPKGIMFLFESENDHAQVFKTKRWQTLARIFRETLRDYVTEVNLMYFSIQDLHKRMSRLTEEEQKITFQLAYTNLRNGIQNVNLYKNPDVEPDFYYFDNDNTRVLVERMEGYESKKWYQGLEAYKRQKRKFGKVTIVYFFKDHYPVLPTDFKGIGRLEKEFYQNVQIMKIDSYAGEWFDCFDARIEGIKDASLTI